MVHHEGCDCCKATHFKSPSGTLYAIKLVEDPYGDVFCKRCWKKWEAKASESGGFKWKEANYEGIKKVLDLNADEDDQKEIEPDDADITMN